VELQVAGLDASGWAALERHGTVLARRGDTLRLRVASEEELPAVAATVVARGARLYRMSPARPSLEATFLEVMGADQRPG